MHRYLLALALLIVASDASATNGYFSNGFGIESIAQGGVGIAIAHDTLTIASNPAGLTAVSDGLEFGLQSFAPKRSSDILQAGGDVRYSGDDTRTFWIPEAGYSRHIDPQVAVGVALFGNGGLNTDYRNNPFARFGAQGTAGVDLSQAFLSPAVAVKLGDAQSVGLALNLAYQRFKAKGIGAFAAFSADPAHLSDQGYDDSTGWGVRLGWTGRIGEYVTLGATWQSKTRMGRFAKYSGLFADGGKFDIPENFGLGIALKPDAALSVTLDWQQIQYSGVPSVGNPINSLFAGVSLGAPNGPGFGWRDISVWKLGASYQLTEALTVLAGASTGDQPVAASQTFFNILAPGVVQTHASLGATWKLSGSSDLSVNYVHAFQKTVSGSGSIPPAFGGGEVSIRLEENSFGIAFRHRFGRT